MSFLSSTSGAQHINAHMLAGPPGLDSYTSSFSSVPMSSLGAHEAMLYPSTTFQQPGSSRSSHEGAPVVWPSDCLPT